MSEQQAPEGFRANPGRDLAIEIDGVTWLRLPIATHAVQPGSGYEDVFLQYVTARLQPGDIVIASEKMVGGAQGRVRHVDDIKPGYWARVLTKYISKVPYGIGVTWPQTMQLAIEEVGLPRILFAAFCAAITKPFGLKGVFYRIAGRKVAAIDGPADYNLPPFDKYCSLMPDDPDGTSDKISMLLGGTPVAIVDANDLGQEVLGVSKGLDAKFVKKCLIGNPLGQGRELTPIGIIRRAEQ